MSFNDPISAFLTHIRNAKDAKHKYVDVMLTNMNMNLTKLLEEKGFVGNFLHSKERRKIRIFLKYKKNRESLIRGLKRISKPGLRKYVSSDNIPYVLGGVGMAVVSTSKGVIDDHLAREENVGGELLCYIW